jgi:hypothetical protein
MKEIEIYVQGKKFIAHSMAEADLILKIFKGWELLEPWS